ncbi:hypothetical protein O988_06108 [Pseudogymnoascus sp. VKM F-3808]|nr:hypothetical protein O988_06108 [Pseudogymnoascus sp. VKM F-3808]
MLSVCLSRRSPQLIPAYNSTQSIRCFVAGLGENILMYGAKSGFAIKGLARLYNRDVASVRSWTALYG